jgi:VanZ family protein
LKGRHWLPPLIWAGVIVFATSIPASAVPRKLGSFDKFVHFGMYAVLAGLVTFALRDRKAMLRVLLVAALAVAAFGAVDEWHQQFIPGRRTEMADWVADAAGGLVGVVVTYLLLLRWPKRSQA